MKNILAPLGISDNAKNTLAYAIDLAAKSQANLYVMDTFNPSFPNAHLLNVKQAMGSRNRQRIKTLIQQLDSKGVNIQMASYDGDFLSGIASLDQQVQLDLIVCGPVPNTDDEAVFLGPTAGSVVKKTDIPVLIVPEGHAFSEPKKALFAFKRGEIKGNRSLAPVHYFKTQFQTAFELLLVKVPNQDRKDQQIDHEIVELSNKMGSTENGTVYQGVLEHFQSVQPDLLVVFARKRGFFEKLLGSDVVLKKDFFTKTPLLVLKNRK